MGISYGLQSKSGILICALEWEEKKSLVCLVLRRNTNVDLIVPFGVLLDYVGEERNKSI